LVFIALVVLLLFLDLFVFHRKAKKVPFSEAMWLTVFWIAISLVFAGFIWYLAGLQAAGEYITAYVIEKASLAGQRLRVPILVSLLIIAVIVTASVVASLITTRTGKIGKKGLAGHNQAHSQQ
jgi:hypothetical protein